MSATRTKAKSDGSNDDLAVVPRNEAADGATEVQGGKDVKRHGGGGLTEGDEDMEASPVNNIPLVFSAISLVLFLAALDVTIVATALPSIASDLHANPSQYGWVGTSYLLATTAFTPLWGRFSDIAGRKPVLYGGIIIFTVGSALCGAAKTINWLITARAFQGIGGGAIISLTTIVISDIIPLSKRGHYNGALGATWGIASVLGPLLGGLLTDKATWRWCFYINLPTCAIAFVFLLFTLKLNPTKGHTFAQLKATFDFVGLVLIMSAGSLLVVGFAMASDHGFGNKSTIALIAVGAALLVASFAHFLTTSRNAIIPARALRTRTTTLFLLGSILHATAFISSNYYVPVYLQGVRGADALNSGIQLLPYSILVAVLTIVAGQIVTRLRIVRPVAWCGYALAGLGYGLWYEFLSYDYSIAVQEGILTVAAIGIGLSLQTPVIVIQAAMPLKDMAAATSAYLLARSLGGTLGISIFGAVLNAELRKRLSVIPGYGIDFQLPVTAEDYRAIHSLSDSVIRGRVIQAFSDSASVIWIIYCGLLLGALLVTLPTRAYSMNRAPPPAKVDDGQPEGDLESQTPIQESK